MSTIRKSLQFNISETDIEWASGGADYIRHVIQDYMNYTTPIKGSHKRETGCNFYLSLLKVNKIKNSKCTYADYVWNIPISIDIETSSWEDETGTKFSCMYIWMLGINGQCIYGRTWEEFLEMMNALKEFTTSQENPCITDIIQGRADRLRFIIYVHNLGYEFQFIRKYFNWISVFTDTARKPIYALAEGGLEFRDSLRLTGLSLAKSCENLTKYKIKKMVGDLDYDLLRSPETPLTDKEMGYVRHDVTGLNAIIKERMELENDDISGIPYTNTGYVRRSTRRKCYSKEYKTDYTRLMRKLKIPDIESYKILKEGFSGGFTHACYLWVGKHIQGKIDSFDFTSSYPAVMLSEKFPMGECTRVDCSTVSDDEIKRCLKNYACVFRISFEKIRKKDDVYEVYLSKNKCYNIEGGIFDNGRVWSADSLTTTITNVDLTVINKCYDFDNFIITDLLCWKWDYLPKPIIESTLDYYVSKTTLKGVSGKEDEYMMNKGLLNAEFGMMVQDIIHPEIIYNGNWETEEMTEDLYFSQLTDYNDNKTSKRFTYYPWGLFVTSWARRNLWSGILEFGDDYIYSDTDSIKCLNSEKHMDYINDYNSRIVEKIDRALNSYNIDTELSRPKTVKGKVKQLGVWDFETDEEPYTDFKTLGAKRYIYKQAGDLHITVAGVPKSAGTSYLLKFDNPFDAFRDGMTIPENESNKLVCTYLDDEFETVIKDYQGKYYKVHEMSAINLKKTSYTMTMSNEFLDFLNLVEDWRK